MIWPLGLGILWLSSLSPAAAPEGLPAGLAALTRVDFDTALPILQQAAQSQSTKAGAHLALGRLHRLAFDRVSALKHFSEAFAASPDDAEVLATYAAATPDRSLELALLRRLVDLHGPDAACLRRIALLKQLGGRTVNRLKTPYTGYRLRMPVAYSRESRAAGWLVSVELNGSHPLRLMLDTGARGLLVTPSAARSAKLERLGETEVGGFGTGGARRAELLLAESMRIGELAFANVMVAAANHDFPAELDGLIGLDLFRQFRITLDGKSSLLRLTPFPDAEPADGEGERPWPRYETGASGLRSGRTLLQSRHLLIAPVQLEAGPLAHFVLDSGAAYSMVQTQEPAVVMRQVSLQGLSGFTSADEVLRPMRIEFPGGRRALLREAIATDLSPVSESFGVQIDGFVGFPMLRRLVTTIDLRSGALNMQ